MYIGSLITYPWESSCLFLTGETFLHCTAPGVMKRLVVIIRLKRFIPGFFMYICIKDLSLQDLYENPKQIGGE